MHQGQRGTRCLTGEVCLGTGGVMAEWQEPDDRCEEKPPREEPQPVEQTWAKRPVRWTYGEPKSKRTEES
jgi:hypothetical protein